MYVCGGGVTGHVLLTAVVKNCCWSEEQEIVWVQQYSVTSSSNINTVEQFLFKFALMFLEQLDLCCHHIFCDFSE